MSDLQPDELHARFLHLHRLVIERPLGLIAWADETSEYFELRELLGVDR